MHRLYTIVTAIGVWKEFGHWSSDNLQPCQLPNPICPRPLLLPLIYLQMSVIGTTVNPLSPWHFNYLAENNSRCGPRDHLHWGEPLALLAVGHLLTATLDLIAFESHFPAPATSVNMSTSNVEYTWVVFFWRFQLFKTVISTKQMNEPETSTVSGVINWMCKPTE